MIQITLTAEDAGILRGALEEYVSDLRMEIADTGGMDFRDQLKQKEAFLKRILAQLAPEGG